MSSSAGPAAPKAHVHAETAFTAGRCVRTWPADTPFWRFPLLSPPFLLPSRRRDGAAVPAQFRTVHHTCTNQRNPAELKPLEEFFDMEFQRKW